ncbi:dipeptide epimerase [Anaerosalibacter massiliensis]|uniref:dipeptide epimerase n=1 Tax=Anaerosalibacter massiliensis TaxID=1347392 RepID=UPI0005B2B6DD|nr:dipeptide epimerase [Anaerosalibacter massiliensis]
MKIRDIQVGEIKIPLKKPFRTALREVYTIENAIVRIETDTGNVGYGEAAITPVITGDTMGSIKWAIMEHIRPSLIGMDIENIEEIMNRIDNSLVNNSSPKAAVDMAIYDLYGQLYNTTVYKLLGGYRNKITTDITVSVNDPEEMAQDSVDALDRGYKTIKVKVGKDWKVDLLRLETIRKAVGNKVNIRIDANQGWTPKEAVRVMRMMEDKGLDIELVEQPVKAYDIEGLKYVTDNIDTPVMADESVFSPQDAVNIIINRAADLVNIKLMKTGGIHNAIKICNLAEIYEMECMLGCMMESKIGLTAACHLAGGKSIITKFDLDAPNLCAEDPVDGGAIYKESLIVLEDDLGFGFRKIGNIIYD